MKKILNRKHILYFTLICLMGCVSCNHHDSDSTLPKMNLLLITIDTVRADRLGCYGYPKKTSPNMDKLSENAVLFENAISQSAVTPVSHASIMTGLLPQNHQLRSLHGGVNYELQPGQLTLAEIMKSNGYRTGGFVSAFPVTHHYGLHQGFDEWDQQFENNDGKGLITDKDIVNTGNAQRRADVTASRTLSWLKQNAQQPFFIWAHFFDVHDPVLKPPKEYLEQFPFTLLDEINILRVLYDCELAFMDAEIGRILKKLEEMGVRKNTAVAIMADHGEGLGDHQWWGHCILYQEQIRIPFILSIPGQKKGKRIRELVRSIDFVPTIVDLLNLNTPKKHHFDGKSLHALINQKGEKKSRVAYSESINDLSAYYDTPYEKESIYSLNDGRWKFIVHREDSAYKSFELFDLETDPYELKNLYAATPQTAERLLNQLESYQSYIDNTLQPIIDEKAKAKLKSLGYIE
ncbi:MAG: sulfatase [Calditrichia bacterium]